ncbi:DUF6688 family protein [Clostridium paraputrificum]|uniref:DUF6688 family protein n=1 Tax=Clostridium paraputrificum TaxID=29363 RepID=UPI003D3261FE
MNNIVYFKNVTKENKSKIDDKDIFSKGFSRIDFLHEILIIIISIVKLVIQLFLILSSWSADLVYILMKPLEWIFKLGLYTVDRKLENGINIQYSELRK